MPALTSSRQNGILLVALLFAQLLLMAGSVRRPSPSGEVESWLMRITSPVVVLAQTVSGAFRGVISETKELLAARSRNTVLEHEVTELRDELARNREASLENARLRQLLDMRENLAPVSIGAGVVTSVLTSRTKLIVVDRGTAEGVEPYLPVVAWGGAVGRVVSADAHFAKVQLLSDPNSGVAGIVQRSRSQGVVFGEGESRLDLRFVPRFSDVAHGDRVVTSGLDGIFPRGFGIGIVDSVELNTDGSQTIKLVPEIRYEALEEVLILLEPIGGEILELPSLGGGAEEAP